MGQTSMGAGAGQPRPVPAAGQPFTSRRLVPPPCAGFSSAFWSAYHELIPRAPGFEEREQIYLLYHYLNHLNLFGDSYYGQCANILSRLTR